MCGVSESEYEERFLKDEPVENGKFISEYDSSNSESTEKLNNAQHHKLMNYKFHQ